METRNAQLSFEIAQKLYAGNDENLRQLALNTYPELGMKITDRVKNFSDVCKLAGEDEDQFKIASGDSDIIKSMRYAGKIMLIAKVLNEGHVFDWNNDNEYKWRPWFCMNDNNFRFDDSGCSISSSTVSARMCFKSEKLSTFAAKTFLQEYKDYLYQK